IEVEPSSIPLSFVPKDKQTTSQPKKRKKRRLIAEAWQYFKLQENFAACQIKITQDEKKNASANITVVIQIQ
ncbi:1710_t:CDS:1, partial [Gigaspora margarita]